MLYALSQGALVASRTTIPCLQSELSTIGAYSGICSRRAALRGVQEEGFSAAGVSYEVGYASPSHFSRAYKELFGMSPLAYAVQCE